MRGKLYVNRVFDGNRVKVGDGIDRAAFGLMDTSNVHFENCDFFANFDQEAMKLSFCSNISFNNCRFHGGIEDCVDIVGSSDINFTLCSFYGSGKVRHHFTIKGSTKRVLIDNCQFFGKAKESTIIALGNFSNYDIKKRPETTDVKVTNCHSNGSSLFFMLEFHAKNNTIENVRHKSLLSKVSLPKFIYKTYFFLRSHGIIGKKPKPDARRM